jgi:hypothetical protein
VSLAGAVRPLFTTVPKSIRASLNYNRFKNKIIDLEKYCIYTCDELLCDVMVIVGS